MGKTRGKMFLASIGVAVVFIVGVAGQCAAPAATPTPMATPTEAVATVTAISETPLATMEVTGTAAVPSDVVLMEQSLMQLAAAMQQLQQNVQNMSPTQQAALAGQATTLMSQMDDFLIGLGPVLSQMTSDEQSAAMSLVTQMLNTLQQIVQLIQQGTPFPTMPTGTPGSTISLSEELGAIASQISSQISNLPPGRVTELTMLMGNLSTQMNQLVLTLEGAIARISPDQRATLSRAADQMAATAALMVQTATAGTPPAAATP